MKKRIVKITIIINVFLPLYLKSSKIGFDFLGKYEKFKQYAEQIELFILFFYDDMKYSVEKNKKHNLKK